MAGTHKRRNRPDDRCYLNDPEVGTPLHDGGPQPARDTLSKIDDEVRPRDSSRESRLLLPTFLTAFCDHLKTRQTYKSFRKDVSRLRNVFGEVCTALKIRPPGRPSGGCERVQPDKYAGDHVNAKFLEDVTPEILNQFFESRTKRSHWAAKTANNIREILHRLFA